MADLAVDGQTVVLAKGGKGGWGISTSSPAPTARRASPHRRGGRKPELKLELKVLADVGLLGMPNARQVDLHPRGVQRAAQGGGLPFTTLHPNLGVVRVDRQASFVIADIPGLIEGAAEGAGLGIQFLRHLARTRLLLHLVDIAPPDRRSTR